MAVEPRGGPRGRYGELPLEEVVITRHRRGLKGENVVKVLRRVTNGAHYGARVR